jgi:hypothetical protein
VSGQKGKNHKTQHVTLFLKSFGHEMLQLHFLLKRHHGIREFLYQGALVVVGGVDTGSVCRLCEGEKSVVSA